jgi:two-component system, chemotaxis family, protein-glutamate methylesterase/glutaminase
VTATTSNKGRVVVTDDSRLMRRMLSDALTRQGFEVVGSAADGDEALELCRRHRPDALTLDLHMPGLDGLGVLKALRDGKADPVPVVVVSAFSPAHGARAVDALAGGAFDLVAKPAIGEGMENFTVELGRKVAEAAHAGRARRSTPRPAVVRPARRPGAVSAPAGVGGPCSGARRPRPVGSAVKKLVLIACSTGGPKALGELMPALPGRLGSGTLIVQHMPAGFTASLAARLDGSSKLTVREAAGREVLDPSLALIAPGGKHLRVGDDRRTLLNDDAPEGGLKPRADHTIEDAARLYGNRLLLVVLTGMGRDGLRGAKAVKAAGGTVLVEAENTCTVYGMPRAIAEAGLADEVLDLGDLPAAIAREAS